MADGKENKEEQEGAEAEGAEGAKPASKKKLFIIIGAVVLLLVVIGVPAAYFLVAKEAPEVSELEADAAHSGASYGSLEGALDEDEYDENEKPLGAFFPLETFIVNLRGGRYVRVQMQLEFIEREIPKKFYGRIVPTRDAIISLLASKSQDDLSNEKGREQLKKEIGELINEIMKREEVKQVYFTQFVVQ